MSEVRCHCGFGRIDECERFGHEQGSRLDHERALRNLDRSQKRLRKFKRAMANFFPHIDASETDNAIRTIYDEVTSMCRRLNEAEFKVEAMRRADGLPPTASNAFQVSLPASWNTTPVRETPIEPCFVPPDPPEWDGHTLCEGCGAGATRADNEGVPLCYDCWSELVPDENIP